MMTESEVRSFVNGFNELVRRMPRAAGNFLALEVPCSLEELHSGFPEARGSWQDVQKVRLPDFARFSHGSSVLSLASLVTALCPPTVWLKTVYDQGVPQLEVVSRVAHGMNNTPGIAS